MIYITNVDKIYDFGFIPKPTNITTPEIITGVILPLLTSISLPRKAKLSVLFI